MSSDRSVSDALSAYLAGRMPAERLAGVISAAYYGVEGRGQGDREGLKGIVEVIEQAHPGVIELSRTPAAPGFAVQLAERPFPAQYEDELRSAVEAARARLSIPPPVPGPGLLARVYRRLRRLFTASR
ncbi:MAG: hypothetical protein ACREME_12420 [Gemmatimonadales bacterium]